MFHRYVEHNGQKIDYDRASWLMDKDVFSEALEALPKAIGQTDFDHAIAKRNGWSALAVSKEDELQTLWDLYCAGHIEKYGDPFNPDVM
jgi:hypothetical protein